MRRAFYAAGVIAVLVSPLALSGEASGRDRVLATRCFYGRSNSFSSRPTGLSGEIFVVLAVEDGKETTFKMVFHHRLKFFKAVGKAIVVKGTTEIKGHFVIDGTKIPFQMQVKNGTIFGELGTGLDKGVIHVEDFDKGTT